MALGIILIVASLAGLIYGRMKKNKTLMVSSAIVLIAIAIIWIAYSYLYSLNPY